MKRMKRLVLVGAGHAHAHVLLDFAQSPVPGLEILLVAPVALAPYSGMVPGWLAGHYRWEECCVDFERLCARAGARLVSEYAKGLDHARSELILADGGSLPYDLLSLDIGSTLAPAAASADTLVLPMRPLSTLRGRWEELLGMTSRLSHGSRFRVLMIGGGAAGVESILAAAHRLRPLAPEVHFAFMLATHGDAIVPGLAAGAGRRLQRHLKRQGIQTVTGFRAGNASGKSVQGEDGRVLEADVVLWATGAEPYAWPEKAGLACDARGFIRVDSTLRSVSHPTVFASGDCAAWEPPLPKAGVYAVRMGPILAHNLRAAVIDDALRAYQPQRRFLVLIGTGAAHAVAAWGPLSCEGDWVWRWKQRIDRRFVARHTER
jgi:pyridine nucleotide-disulfide oxidoreductase family protein